MSKRSASALPDAIYGSSCRKIFNTPPEMAAGSALGAGVFPSVEPVLYEVGGFVMAKRWKRRPAGSNWGEFGDDDELGRLNYLTPDAVLEGVREVRTGIRFGLSLPLELPGGAVLNERRLPPDYKGTMAPGFVYIHFPLGKPGPDNSDALSVDQTSTSTQFSTPWDSPAHN